MQHAQMGDEGGWRPDLTRAASKAAIMNGSKAAYRPPALQLLCLCDGGHQRQTSKSVNWGVSSCSSSQASDIAVFFPG